MIFLSFTMSRAFLSTFDISMQASFLPRVPSQYTADLSKLDIYFLIYMEMALNEIRASCKNAALM